MHTMAGTSIGNRFAFGISTSYVLTLIYIDSCERILKSKHGGHIEWVPPSLYPPPSDAQREYKPGQGVGGW